MNKVDADLLHDPFAPLSLAAIPSIAYTASIAKQGATGNGGSGNIRGMEVCKDLGIKKKLNFFFLNKKIFSHRVG